MPCFCCSEPWKRGRLLVKQLEDLIAGSASGGGAKVTGGAASELDGSFYEYVPVLSMRLQN